MEELCHVGIIQRPSVRKISEVLVLAKHFVQLCSEEFETSLNRYCRVFYWEIQMVIISLIFLLHFFLYLDLWKLC